MKRQYTSKRNLCPVCGNHHGCAIREDGLIECLRSFSQQDAPVGYRFLTLLRNDMGGLFVLDDGSNQKETPAYSQQQRYSIDVKVKERLSIEERDRQFQLLRQATVTTLSTQHSTHLQQRRQLSTQEINWVSELGWLLTWEPGLYAPNGVTTQLPGISPDGKLLGRSGIAIAALDPDFHITGFQIATLQNDPKYIWLSGINYGGNGPQLPNGELPLFCWKHPDTKNVKVVILCEGALKSLLTALFLWRTGQTDIAVIGTASAARYGEKTLKDYLKRLRPKEIRLMPDAGAILNTHIAKANEETLQRCHQWGYRISVGDWGQLDTKEYLDIDELLAAGRQNEVKLITSAAYLSQSHTHRQINQLLKQGSFHLLSDRQIELRPREDSIKNLDLIRHYAKGISQCRKGGYQVIVVWNDQTITPSDFFALCPESIQKQLAFDDREWGMLYNLKLWFRRMVERYRPKNGFGKKNPAHQTADKTLDENQKDNTIEYKPGKLPRIGDCAIPPKIVFKKGQRLQVYTEAIALGWKHILDNSPTGTFKSHDAGIATPKAFGVDKLWYFTSHARNVTTETVERNYSYLEVRNSGMVWDYTPNGKPYLRWPKNGEVPDTKGNCHRSSVFTALRNKNILVDEGPENPVCSTCHLLEACRSVSGTGFGHKSQRRETLESLRIVTHPDSAPDTNDYDWSNCGNFWDEAMRTVQPIGSIAASLLDLNQVIAELAIHYPEINIQLQPLWMVLRYCLTGEIKQPLHGWNDAAVREMLGYPPENLDEIITQAMSILNPNLNSLFNTTCEYGVDLNDLPGKLRKRFGDKNFELTQKIQFDVILNWFVPFLQVWGRRIKGALRINQSQLLISTRNERHAQIAQAAGWNIYLDATATPDYLCWWMGVDADDILTVEQEVSASKNLKIIQVTGLGQVSKQRSDFCQSRVHALRQEFLVRHPDIKFIDFVKFCNEGDGGWFRDSRGSNDFKDITALATFGIPYQNIGSLEALYLTIGRCDFSPESVGEKFQRFVDWATQAEIKQAIGRLRSHNRPMQQVYFYFCADYDLSFLSPQVECVKASDITIEAGSLDEKSWWKVKNAVKELWEIGQKITQSAVEAVSGISQGYISKLATEFGGSWKEWLKIFLSLLNTSYTTRNNSEYESCRIPEEAHSIVCTVMELLTQYDDPDVLLKEIFSWQKYLDNQYWEWILETTPLKLQAKIIAALEEV
ncbi:hypothetical protein [Iningainema tapete]|uniref:Uncharacterized protein n=1 Tax=Iningainema tapete BLCC-T55 TaxID=2748662 RepID=A0A8J7BWV2_9CYAN|nr:hypothetical protein [Iningainema tapete]MBD2772517.1 hypothetical protein [Iningainema tapete BLCC-T55]